MINYFNDVYIHRINRFGTGLQERIINKKEYDFHHFVKKSPNRVTVFIQDYQFEGVLQTKTYDEIETIDYFLTYKTIPINNGSILKVRSIKDMNSYSYWIIVARDNFTSAGYNRYTVIKLDREIRWITEDGLIFKALAHISGSGSGGTNRRLISSTKIVNESVVYMPNQVLTVTMQDHKEIKRGTRINIGGQVWKISGFDNVTNEGVSYVTLEQDYFDKERDEDKHLDIEPPYEDGLADGEKIDKWTFDSELKEETVVRQRRNKDGELVDIEFPAIKLSIDSNVFVNFRASYFDKVMETPVVAEVKDATIVRYNKADRTLTSGSVSGETSIFVRLADSPDIYQEFIVIVEETGTATDFSVECAGRIKCGIPTEVYSRLPFEFSKIYYTVEYEEYDEEAGKRVIKTKEIVLEPKIDYFLSDCEYIWEEIDGRTLLKATYTITFKKMFKKLTIDFSSLQYIVDTVNKELIYDENVEIQYWSKDISIESPWIGG